MRFNFSHAMFLKKYSLIAIISAISSIIANDTNATNKNTKSNVNTEDNKKAGDSKRAAIDEFKKTLEDQSPVASGALSNGALSKPANDFSHSPTKELESLVSAEEKAHAVFDEKLKELEDYLKQKNASKTESNDKLEKEAEQIVTAQAATTD